MQQSLHPQAKDGPRLVFENTRTSPLPLDSKHRVFLFLLAARVSLSACPENDQTFSDSRWSHLCTPEDPESNPFGPL